LSWAAKWLSDTPIIQSRFRSALQQAFPAAKEERRAPTATEITSAHSPYIDAVIEEAIRTSLTAPGISRSALVDTTLLGHRIPKGTVIFMMNNGPDYKSPGLPIAEELRSESCRAVEKDKRVGSWSGDAAQMSAFTPERWLVKDAEGKDKFEPTAGPTLSFGLGPRGCFGRRLAYLELRIMLVMLFWTFEFKQVPAELNSFAQIDKLTSKPKHVYIRLEKVEL
jgi:cytochrome P450